MTNARPKIASSTDAVLREQTFVRYVLAMLLAFLRNRIPEKTTIIGLVAFVATVAENPEVFVSVHNIYNAVNTEDGFASVLSAVLSLMLILVREHKSMSTKDRAALSLSKRR